MRGDESPWVTLRRDVNAPHAWWRDPEPIRKSVNDYTPEEVDQALLDIHVRAFARTQPIQQPITKPALYTDDALITITEAAFLIDRDRQTLHAAIREGRVPTYKVRPNAKAKVKLGEVKQWDAATGRHARKATVR